MISAYLILSVFSVTQSVDRLARPDNRVAPDNAAAGHARLPPDDGIAPDDRIAQHSISTPDNRVAPDDAAAPDNAVAPGNRQAVAQGGFAGYGIEAGYR